MCVCVCAHFPVFASTEDLKSQLDQEEDKTSKIKQLLVKTKKDLANAKTEVSIRVYASLCVCVYAFTARCPITVCNIAA